MKKIIEKYPIIGIIAISLFGLFVYNINREFMVMMIFVMLVVINHNIVVTLCRKQVK